MSHSPSGSVDRSALGNSGSVGNIGSVSREDDEARKEAIKEQLLLLSKQDEYNSVCADCGDPNPSWASTNLGIFICITCAGFHRSLGVQISKVKSVQLDGWKMEDYESMKSHGNKISNDIYEGSLGSVKPVRSVDSKPLREQWIRAKYVRKLYPAVPKDQQPSIKMPEFEGFMTKQGNIVKNWRRRYFKLSGTLLFYFKKQGDPVPQGIVCIADTVSPPDCLAEALQDRSHTFAVQIPSREYQFSADNGEEMYDWIQALRTARSYLMHPSQHGYTAKARDVTSNQLDMVISELVRLGNQKTKMPNGKVVTGCVYGAQVVDSLIHSFQLESRQEAIFLGNQLVSQSVLVPVSTEKFADMAALFKIGDRAV